MQYYSITKINPNALQTPTITLNQSVISLGGYGWDLPLALQASSLPFIPHPVGLPYCFSYLTSIQ